MFAYKTNSPHYLDYVASVLTREQIQADPELCVFLENPYIKDNVEVALRWNDAKFGDYQDKYNFVEYYLCNGPELDADTLLHYRALAQSDPVVMEIAYSYFNNNVVLSQIREEKYNKGKKDDWTDCFTNPCFYLGDFSGVMGSMGDPKNVATLSNVVGEMVKSWMTEKRITEDDEKRKRKTGQFAAEEGSFITKGMISAGSAAADVAESAINTLTGGSKPLEPRGSAENFGDGVETTGQGPCSEHLEGHIHPAFDNGWRKMGKILHEETVQFAKEVCQDVHHGRWYKSGDWFSRVASDAIDLVDKANVVRQLGDCYRMWSLVRRLRWFGSDNQMRPITPDLIVGDINPDGTVTKLVADSHPTPNSATPNINDKKIKQVQTTSPDNS